MPDEQPQAERYRARRKRLAEQLGGGVALIHSSGAAPDPALEDMNLFYLTGLKDRSAYLLLAPQGLYGGARRNSWRAGIDARTPCP